jgi:hypothetical protein
MKSFDHLAWLCSWLAPASWTAVVAAILLNVSAAKLGQPPNALQAGLPIIALAFGSLGLVSGALLGYHVLKSRLFSAAERKMLTRHLWFGLGYAHWRRLMRSHLGGGHRAPEVPRQ